jgi:hypothetical protein
MAEPGFLTASSELEDFDRQGRRIPRSVREMPDDSGDSSSASFGEVLDQVVTNALRSQTQSSARSWRCLCIEVAEDDGMTWSAETARRAAGESAAHFRQICLPQGRRPDHLPQIASWIGEYKFLRLAVAHKLTSEFVALRSWVTPALVAAVVLLTAALEVLKRLSTEHVRAVPGFLDLFLQPAFWAQTAGLFVLSFGLKFLKSRLDTDSESKSCKRFVKQLNDIPRMHPYARFRQALAEEMARSGYPRVVVVDSFEGQDEITRDVIHEYFQNARKLAAGSELWVVFEKEDGDRVGAALRNSARPPDRSSVRLYKQLFLTGPEKKSLLSVLQNSPGAEEYTTVRSICRQDGKGAEAVKRFLKEYRQGHPAKRQQYDAFHILYLLAITASPGQASFDYRELATALLQTGKLRSEVLLAFLSASTLHKEYLLDLFREIMRFPSDVVIWDDSEQPTACRATREAQDFLVKNYGDREFRLPEPDTGHLFWAFLYFDQLQNHVREAFWVRKLIYHLGRASTKGVSERPSYPKLRQQFFDAHLFAVSAGLGSCLFKEIPEMLERASSLIATEDLNLCKQQQNRLLRACWNAYSVLGDERILQVIFDLYSPGPLEVETAAHEDALSRFFTDLLPFKGEQSATLKEDFFRWIQREYAGDDAVVDDCRARAAWFILTLAPMLEFWRGSYLLHALLHADWAVENLTRRALARLGAPGKTPPRIAEAITVSLGLWSCALRLHRGAKERTLFAWYSSQSGGKAQPLAIPELSSLLKLCDQAINIAAGLRDYREPDTTLAANLLFGAMARELGVISLAAAQVGCALHLRGLGKEPDGSFYADLESIARRCSEVLDFELPVFESPRDLLGNEMIEKTGALLRACELVWQDFGLTRLHDFLNLRRVHFAALAQELPAAHFDESTPLVKSLIPLLVSSSYGGVLANCLVAACLQKTAELSAFYLHRAARTAVDAGLPDTVKKEFCLLAMAGGHMYDYDLTPHLNWLLRDPPSPSRLDEFLAAIDEEGLVNFAFVLMNVAHASRPSELGTRVLGIVRKLSVAKTLSGVTREQLRAIVDVRELELKLGQGMPVSPDEILKSWEDRKPQVVYSTVLSCLMQNGYASPRIDEESLELLSRHPLKNSYTGFLELSLVLGERLYDSRLGERDTGPVASVLSDGIRRWEGHISAPLTVAIYRLLSRLEPSRYLECSTHIAEAQRTELRCNYVKRLPELARGGRFFALFFDYWRGMSYWGLSCDWGPDLLPQLNLDPSKREELVTGWLAGGAKVPAPFSSRNIVNGEFLVIGNALISPPVDGDPRFDAARQAFNEAAQVVLPSLLKSIQGLKELPDSIRVLIQAHEERMQEFTSILTAASGSARLAFGRGA